MPDEHKDPVAEAQAQRVADIGIRSEIQDPTGEAAPSAPPAEAPVYGKDPNDWIPKARFDKVNNQRKEAEQRAQYWDALLQDPEAMTWLQQKYNTGTGSPPPTAQPARASQWDDENLEGVLDPRVMRELDAVKRQVAQIVAPVMQASAQQQRALLQQKFPDYDPSADDATIRTVMASGRASNLVDAYTLIRAERGDIPSKVSKKAETRAAASVQASTSQVQNAVSELDKLYAEAKKRHHESGGTDPEAVDDMLAINADRDRFRKFLAQQGG